ncbi:septum formation initiator family protein [Sphingomonas sp.]|uniref:FtsB family cell division protein n=1 Tax=Sphingomonas sp. TaxID=28214 RepID=UPI0035A9A912
MISISQLSVMVRRAAPAMLALGIMAFFAVYALVGSNGLFAYGDYQRRVVEQRAEFDRLDKQRAALKNRVKLLDPRHANPDMVDEVTRQKLNVVHPDELIIPLK